MCYHTKQEKQKKNKFMLEGNKAAKQRKQKAAKIKKGKPQNNKTNKTAAKQYLREE